ncbi:MAG: phage protein [Gemmataceae bacterium]|nr:phage protein [Gemmataceae bacterium]
MSGKSNARGRWPAVIAALLTERTHEAAAAKAGISGATLRRYLTDPAFVREYRRARRDVVEAAISRIQGAAAKAVDVLERLLDSDSAAIQLRAAALLLDQAVQGVSAIDVDSRLADVEARLSPEGKPVQPSPWGADSKGT